MSPGVQVSRGVFKLGKATGMSWPLWDSHVRGRVSACSLSTCWIA